MGQLSKFPYLGINLEFELPQGAENELIFALRAIIIKIWQFFTLIRLISYVN